MDWILAWSVLLSVVCTEGTVVLLFEKGVTIGVIVLVDWRNILLSVGRVRGPGVEC